MKQYSKTIDNLFMLEYYLSHAPYGNVAKSASSVLCQLYVAESMKKDVPAMLKLLEAFIPGVVIVGSSSCNTISDGLLRNEMTVVSLSFFFTYQAKANLSRPVSRRGSEHRQTSAKQNCRRKRQY